MLANLSNWVQRRWRDGGGPNRKSIGFQVLNNHKLKESTREQWTQIRTQISGTDRQQLSQIVERWGELSDELKRAVLKIIS